MPWPPPMHSVTRPSSWPPRSISDRHLAVIAAPVARDRVAERDRAAVGVDLRLVEVRARLMTASAWAANASLSSITPISSSERPARSSTLRTAGTGPMPMTSGSTPQDA